MKEGMITAGSYLLVGTIACFALAAVAGNVKEVEPPPESAQQETVEVRVAETNAVPAAPKQKAKAKSRRSRKAAAEKKCEQDASPSPRKKRTRKSRKQTEYTTPQE